MNILQAINLKALLKWKNGDPSISKSTEVARKNKREAATWAIKEVLTILHKDYFQEILETHQVETNNTTHCSCGELINEDLAIHQASMIEQALNN